MFHHYCDIVGIIAQKLGTNVRV